MNTRILAPLLALSSIALIAGVGDAGASNAAGTKTTVLKLNGYCDVETVTVFPWHQAGFTDVGCDGQSGIGAGMEGKVTGVSPKDLTIGENYGNNPGVIYLWNIQYPLVTGGSWSIFSSTDGANFSYVNQGTYTITGANRAPVLRAGPSVHYGVRK